MAKHEIEMTVPSTVVRNSDATVLVWSNGRRLGELRLSRGTIDWREANDQIPRILSWERFSEIMLREGRRPRAR